MKHLLSMTKTEKRNTEILAKEQKEQQIQERFNMLIEAGILSIDATVSDFNKASPQKILEIWKCSNTWQAFTYLAELRNMLDKREKLAYKKIQATFAPPLFAVMAWNASASKSKTLQEEFDEILV